jgi:hypothetical protein
MCVKGKEGQLYVPLVLIPGLPEKKIRHVKKIGSNKHITLAFTLKMFYNNGPMTQTYETFRGNQRSYWHKSCTILVRLWLPCVNFPSKIS